MLKQDISRDDSRSSLPQTRGYLDLACLVSVDKQVAHPSQFLRFFCAHLVSKITLARLTEDLQVYVLLNIAESLSACGESGSITSKFSLEDYSLLRNQVIAACPSLLSVSFKWSVHTYKADLSTSVLLISRAKTKNPGVHAQHCLGPVVGCA